MKIPTLKIKIKMKQLCWFANDALSSVGPTKIQLLKFSYSSVSVLVLLSSSLIYFHFSVEFRSLFLLILCIDE